MHKRHDSHELLVVSIPLVKARTALVQRKATQNSSRNAADDVRQEMSVVSNVLQAFLSKASLPESRSKVAVPFDPQNPLNLGSMLQRGLFYAYAGSLTAPPC